MPGVVDGPARPWWDRREAGGGPGDDDAIALVTAVLLLLVVFAAVVVVVDILGTNKVVCGVARDSPSLPLGGFLVPSTEMDVAPPPTTVEDDDDDETDPFGADPESVDADTPR